ncbi:MAG: ABC transporter permease [Ligilactobacillus ruminis]|nr:ABC transporter permease [Ligilactobacillus ruminis]
MKKINKIVLVLLETFKRQVKSWSFLIMVLAPFLAIGLGFLLSKVSSDNAEDMVKDVTEIAVVATSKDLQKQFENQTNVTIRYESLDKAKKALNKDKIAGYVSVSLEKGRYEARYHGKDRLTKRQRPES